MGIRAAKDWLCEEILFLKSHQPFYYTAITNTFVKIIRIKKRDMLDYLDPTYMQNLLAAATERYKYNINR